MEPLGSFFGSTGISTEQFHIFLATELTYDGPPILENTEQLEIQLMPFSELHQMALTGLIADAPSVIALTLAASKIDL